jgi:hypothetical protein
MIMDFGTASLHGGLIQRARPAKVVPLRENGIPAGRAAVVSLRASDIARGRPAPAPEPAPLGRAEETAAPDATRRFGLTVRVRGELRERLHAMRMETGRTAQSILHDALAGHLAALERAETKR